MFSQPSRTTEDKRLLTSSPSLEVLFPLKLVWQSFGNRLSASARDLTQHATSLEEQLGRLDKLDKTWQATLQAAKQPGTPPPVLQNVQSVVDSIARTRQATESVRAHVLDLQSRISEQEARVRTALSLIEQGENRALKSIFVRDSSLGCDRGSSKHLRALPRSRGTSLRRLLILTERQFHFAGLRIEKLCQDVALYFKSWIALRSVSTI